jgi:hypothetical protein
MASTIGTPTHPEEDQEGSTPTSQTEEAPIRNPKNPLVKRDTTIRTSDDAPTLNATTNDEQELTRPPFVRKKKPQTEVETTEDTRSSRSMRNRKI